MLEHYKTLHPKPKNTDGPKKVLQLIRDQMPQNSINKAILNFTKGHRTCVKGGMDAQNVLSEKLFNNIDH